MLAEYITWMSESQVSVVRNDGTVSRLEYKES